MIWLNRTLSLEFLPNPEVGNPQTPIEWVQIIYTKAQAYTALIKEVYEQCLKEGDAGAGIFLQWYISEQNRVEQLFYDLIQECSRSGSNAALLLLDARYRK